MLMIRYLRLKVAPPTTLCWLCGTGIGVTQLTLFRHDRPFTSKNIDLCQQCCPNFPALTTLPDGE